MCSKSIQNFTIVTLLVIGCTLFAPILILDFCLLQDARQSRVYALLVRGLTGRAERLDAHRLTVYLQNALERQDRPAAELLLAAGADIRNHLTLFVTSPDMLSLLHTAEMPMSADLLMGTIMRARGREDVTEFRVLADVFLTRTPWGRDMLDEFVSSVAQLGMPEVCGYSEVCRYPEDGDCWTVACIRAMEQRKRPKSLRELSADATRRHLLNTRPESSIIAHALRLRPELPPPCIDELLSGVRLSRETRAIVREVETTQGSELLKDHMSRLTESCDEGYYNHCLIGAWNCWDFQVQCLLSGRRPLGFGSFAFGH